VEDDASKKPPVRKSRSQVRAQLAATCRKGEKGSARRRSIKEGGAKEAETAGQPDERHGGTEGT